MGVGVKRNFIIYPESFIPSILLIRPKSFHRLLKLIF